MLVILQLVPGAAKTYEESIIKQCHYVSNISQSDCNEEALKENQELRAELQALKESMINYDDRDGMFVLFTLAWCHLFQVDRLEKGFQLAETS